MKFNSVDLKNVPIYRSTLYSGTGLRGGFACLFNFEVRKFPGYDVIEINILGKQ
jgi:hypothetical protein